MYKRQNHGSQRDNHFDCSRGSHKPTKEELDEKLAKMILDMVSASVIQDKKTPRECDMKIGKFGFEDDDEEEVYFMIPMIKLTKMRLRHTKDDVSMPDEAEGQRLNLSSAMNTTDMSKLSLGRMKHLQIAYLYRIFYLWMRELIAPDVTLKHFVSSKVGTLLNMADVLTKQ